MKTNWLYNFIDSEGLEKTTHIPVPEHTYTVLKVIVEPPPSSQNEVEDEEYLFYFTDVKRSLNEPNEIIENENGKPHVLWQDGEKEEIKLYQDLSEMFLQGNLEELCQYLIRSEITISTQSIMLKGLFNRWLEDRSQPDSSGKEENLIFKFMYVSDYQDPSMNPPPKNLLS